MVIHQSTRYRDPYNIWAYVTRLRDDSGKVLGHGRLDTRTTLWPINAFDHGTVHSAFVYI